MKSSETKNVLYAPLSNNEIANINGGLVWFIPVGAVLLTMALTAGVVKGVSVLSQ